MVNNTLYINRRFNFADLLLLIFFIVLCNFVGYLSTFFHKNSLDVWYPMLNKSELTPPGFVFGIMWGILYTIIGLSTFLAFKSSGSKQKISVLFIFFLQLCFNFLWTMFFFGMKSPILALIEIIFLIIFIIIMMKIYKKSNLLSYILLYPYLIWVTFASYLNLIIVFLN